MVITEYKIMHKISNVLLLIFTLSILNSCKEEVKEQTQLTTKAQVSLTKISQGYIPDYIQLSGKTIYLNKNTIIAPISGYIANVNIKQGDKVSKGDLLFKIQTAEAFAIQQKDKSINNFGSVSIYAPVSGRIVSLNVVSENMFTDKGSELSVLLASNDLKLQVNVPYEYNSFCKTGSKCKVILPDNSELLGTFSKILPQVDESSQTIKVLASLNSSIFIPENMIVNVLIDKSKEHQVQILPKQCLQSDALMKEYWIMKLINDSTAVQLPVKIGNQNHNQVEILSPHFNSNDLFIRQGAYGLSDTVLIETKK